MCGYNKDTIKHTNHTPMGPPHTLESYLEKNLTYTLIQSGPWAEIITGVWSVLPRPPCVRVQN